MPLKPTTRQGALPVCLKTQEMAENRRSELAREGAGVLDHPFASKLYRDKRAMHPPDMLDLPSRRVPCDHQLANQVVVSDGRGLRWLSVLHGSMNPRTVSKRKE